MKKLAMVVRDDAYDRLYTPLTFAYVAAREGVEVDILFVLWAVKLLGEGGAPSVTMAPPHAQEADWFRERLKRDGDPQGIDEFMRLLKATGKVRFYGCRLAAATFEVEESRLIPEADGIVDALWFLREKAVKADHCQYF
jgi:peroxiredoxin family protein